MKKIKNILGIIISVLFVLTLIVGIFKVSTQFVRISSLDTKETIIYVIGLAFAGYMAFFLNVLLHEAGHLLFGLICGYSFLLYRIGSLVFVKLKDKIELKRHSIRGTGGQCIMLPEKYSEDDYPYLLYNLGGVIVNYFLAIVFWLIFINRPSGGNLAQGVFYVFCFSTAFIALYLGIINTIPLGKYGLQNDGQNVWDIMHDKDSKHAFYHMLMSGRAQLQDKSYESHQEKDFFVDSDLNINNTLNYGRAVDYRNYLMQNGRTEDAKIWSEKIDNAQNIPDMYKHAYQNQILIEEISQGLPKDELSFNIDKKYLQRLEQDKRNIQANTLLSIYWLLIEDNRKLAKKYSKRVKKYAKNYLVPCEAKSYLQFLDQSWKTFEYKNIKIGI
ncbi:MAG: M50 family metallopeptidase [Tissierellia bacterium]|nr:M50 family metallopeptidase [Tissierellia bacterium]